MVNFIKRSGKLYHDIYYYYLKKLRSHGEKIEFRINFMRRKFICHRCWKKKKNKRTKIFGKGAQAEKLSICLTNYSFYFGHSNKDIIRKGKKKRGRKKGYSIQFFDEALIENVKG